MRHTDRDRAILSAVARFRFLTISLIVALVPGSRQNISRRLQGLFHAGFLDRPRAQLPLRYSGELSEFVYCPTAKTDAGRGYRPVTSLFLAHALMVSEVLIRIASDLQASGARFISESEILSEIKYAASQRRIQWRVMVKADSAKEHIGVIPDAAFAIDRVGPRGDRRRLYYFLEADRGTMPIHRKNLRNSSIRRKALAYAQTRKTRVLKDRFGIPGFQVLFVTRSKERLAGMKDACREAPDGRDTSLFLFSTIAEVRTSSPIQPIYPQLTA
jgi:hypothetical protein